jgi:putative DNA primase/helicase
MSQPAQRQIVTERADQITPRKLRWLWPNRIPLGKVTIFAGLPGEGKSLVTDDIGARVTTARKYPDADNPLPASEVLFVAGEDDAEDALVPRLMAAGADLSKVYILKAVRMSGHTTDHSLRLDLDLAAIKRFFEKHPAIRLAVIDPISNHLGAISMVDEQEVRAALSPLKEVAKVHDLAVLGVMHLNKKEGLSAIHRVGGAGAFIGVARASWLFARDPETQAKRFMLPLKNNYAKESSSLGYRVDEKPVKIENDNVPTPYIEWLDETDLDVDEIISAPRKRASSRTDAKAFLKALLAGGPHDASAIYAAAGAERVSERTLDRAKADLGVESRKKGTEGWEWVLPDGESKNASPARGEVGTLGTLQTVLV